MSDSETIGNVINICHILEKYKVPRSDLEIALYNLCIFVSKYSGTPDEVISIIECDPAAFCESTQIVEQEMVVAMQQLVLFQFLT